MKIKGIGLFVFILITILYACGGGGGNGSSGVVIGAQSYANTSQAASLITAPTGLIVTFQERIENLIHKTLYAITGVTTAFAQSSSNNLIYLVNTTGTVQSVTTTVTTSGDLANLPNNYVINSPNFTLMSYNNLYSSTGTTCALAGIRKSDQEISCINFTPRCPDNNCSVTDYSSEVKTSLDGNILFMVQSDGGLGKVDLTDPWNPIITQILTHSAVGDAAFPVVSGNNDVFTCINLLSSATNIECRIYPVNGADFTLVDHTRPSCVFSGIGADNINLYVSSVNQTNQQVQLIKYSRNANGSFTVGQVPIDMSASGPLTINCKNVVQNSGRIFAINYYNSSIQNNPAYLVEFLAGNNNKTTISHALDTNATYQTDMQTYTGGLAILGVNLSDNSGIIERYAVGTNTATTVLPTIANPTKYYINSISVHPTTGVIKFVGSAQHTGQGVVGTIDANNNITINNTNTTPTAIINLQ